MEAVTLSSIKPGRSPAWLLLALSSGESIAIPADQFDALGLSRGDVLDHARLEQLRERSLNSRALNSALHLLAFRRRSRSELRDRLVRKGYPGPAIESALAWVAERGHLDDGEFARARAHDRLLGRAMGRRGLLNDLRARGIDSETAENAVETALAEHPGGEVALATSAAEKWLRTHGKRHVDPRRQKQALRAALARRGFDLDTIREVT